MARAAPCSKPAPGSFHVRSAIDTSLSTVALSTGRRKARVEKPRPRVADPLVGRWTTCTVKGGRLLTVDFEFTAAGRFVTTVSKAPGKPLTRVTGTWTHANGALFLTLPGGQVEAIQLVRFGDDELSNGPDRWMRVEERR